MQPTLCVVGTDGATTRALVESLTGKDSSAVTWKIVTKYYEVEVAVRQLVLDAEGTPAAPSCEAVVVATRLEDRTERERLRKWVEQGRPAAPISLWVLDSAAEGETRETALEWCVENGFEWIRVSTSEVQRDQQLAEEEGQGMKRLREALEAHVWPGSTFLKAPSLKQDSPNLTTPTDDADDDDFEKLLLEMTNAREMLRALPDEERREGAADLAMKLAQFFVDD